MGRCLQGMHTDAVWRMLQNPGSRGAEIEFASEEETEDARIPMWLRRGTARS